MNMRLIRISALLGLGLLVANEAPCQTSPPASASSSVEQTIEHDKTLLCPQGLLLFLPGEYYACQARADFAHGEYTDFIEALQESAHWANKDAQYELGLAYFNGDLPGVPQNRALGLAWLALAAERKKPQFQLSYAIAKAKATPEEISASLQLLQQLTPKYGDRYVAHHAVRFYDDAIKPIEQDAMYGGKIRVQRLSMMFFESNSVFAKRLQDAANNNFENLRGTVTVGNAAIVGAPASSSSAPADQQKTSFPEE